MYPCEEIMNLVKELDIDVTLASDGHCVNTLAANFEDLEKYLKKFNIQSYVYFEKNKQVRVEIE